MSYTATIGFFDGVHKGHLYLLQRLREEAQMRGMRSAVITFEQHPQQVLTGVAPKLLNTFDERVERLKATGVTQIFAFRFDLVRNMSALEFLKVLHEQCEVNTLLMGYDHQFGADGRKSPDTYRKMGQEAGVEILFVEQAPEGDVSSSKIRKTLISGDVPEAANMLGENYTLQGQVVHGQGWGHRLGFPTANIQIADSHKLIPKNGVYAAQVQTEDGTSHQAVLNIGTNPTIGGNERTVEVHILDFDGDLYAQSLRVELLRYLREEQHFASLDLLKRQIAKDVAEARQ